jgi:hypothetical protein
MKMGMGPTRRNESTIVVVDKGHAIKHRDPTVVIIDVSRHKPRTTILPDLGLTIKSQQFPSGIDLQLSSWLEISGA